MLSQACQMTSAVAPVRCAHLRLTRRARAAVRSIGPLHRMISRLRQNRLHEPQLRRAVAILGAGEGAFGVDLNSLGASSVIYSAGVGDDLTFEAALMGLVGCAVHAFDPAPSAAEWVKKNTSLAQLEFHPVGLAAADGTMEIHLTSRHSSDIRGGPARASCRVARLSSLMETLGHSQIDLLKLHIEGGEYAVIQDMLAGDVRPKLLIVAYHHKMYGIRPQATRDSVRDLRNHGYEAYWISNNGHEYGFVRTA